MVFGYPVWRAHQGTNVRLKPGEPYCAVITIGMKSTISCGLRNAPIREPLPGRFRRRHPLFCSLFPGRPQAKPVLFDPLLSCWWRLNHVIEPFVPGINKNRSNIREAGFANASQGLQEIRRGCHYTKTDAGMARKTDLLGRFPGSNSSPYVRCTHRQAKISMQPRSIFRERQNGCDSQKPHCVVIGRW